MANGAQLLRFLNNRSPLLTQQSAFQRLYIYDDQRGESVPAGGWQTQRGKGIIIISHLSLCGRLVRPCRNGRQARTVVLQHNHHHLVVRLQLH